MKKIRVIVTAPHRPKPLYGERVGEFSNKTGRWINVRVDGWLTTRWFWHEYVKEES